MQTDTLDHCGTVEAIEQDATDVDATRFPGPQSLSDHGRSLLNRALLLAGEAEQDRRSGRLATAESHHREWKEVMAAVKRLLPLVRKTGVSVFATGNSPMVPGRSADEKLDRPTKFLLVAVAKTAA